MHSVTVRIYSKAEPLIARATILITAGRYREMRYSINKGLGGEQPMPRCNKISFCIDMRSEEEKYLDGLLDQHARGEHEDIKARDCQLCECED